MHGWFEVVATPEDEVHALDRERPEREAVCLRRGLDGDARVGTAVVDRCREVGFGERRTFAPDKLCAVHAGPRKQFVEEAPAAGTGLA